MGKIKIFVVPSVDPRSDDVKRWFVGDRFEIVKRPTQADLIVVPGGDGAMLIAIHKYCRIGVPFLGINRGTRGCLLNSVDDADGFEALLEKELKLYPLKLLKVTFVTKAGKERAYLAFNDVYINAESGTEVQGIIRGREHRDKPFRGDGIIVATAQGSTAYNRSAGGSVLPLNSSLLLVTSICQSAVMLPIRDVINPQRLEIEITRGNAIGHADTKHHKVINIRKVIIEPSPFEVRLAFDPNSDLEERRYQ